MNKMETTNRKKLAYLSIVAIVLGLAFSNIYLTKKLTQYEVDAELILEIETGYCAHITVTVQRAGSDVIELIKDGVAINNAGTLTTLGKNWIEDQLGDSPSTDPAEWISLSLNVSAPAAGWTEIPNEIVANGLERAASTYTSTGNGVWTIAHQWTASDAHVAVQLTGLQYANAGDNNLLCADTFAAVTLASGDKLTVTWTITVT